MSILADWIKRRHFRQDTEVIVLLSTSEHREMSGRAIKETTGWSYIKTYTVLNRMVDSGLLKMRLDHTNIEVRGGYPRRIYSLREGT